MAVGQSDNGERDMKICVVGAGAIGGLMGAQLAMAGEDVTVIDPGDRKSVV